jgi:PAS domain S-box-containing protein
MEQSDQVLKGEQNNRKAKDNNGLGKSIEKLVDENYSLKGKILELEDKYDDLSAETKILREEYDKLSKFFGFSPVGFVCMSLDSDIMRFNDKLPQMLGYSKDTLPKSTLKDYIFEEDIDKYNYFRSKILNSSTTHVCELRLVKSNGTYLNARLDGILVDYDTRHMHISVSDNTYIKIYEDSIRENEKKFRTLIEGLNDAIFRMSLPEGKLEYLSKSASEVFGYPIERFFSQSPFISHIIHPDIKDVFAEKWLELINGIVPQNYEYKILDNDGNVRWIMQSNKAILDSSGKITGLEGVCRNITEIKLIQDAIKQSEERFRAIANYTYDWENWTAPNGQLIWINPSVERITGYPAEECLQMDDFPIPIITDEFREKAKTEFRDALRNKSITNEIPFKITRKDGVERWISASWQPIYSNEGAYLGLRSSMRDITKRMQIQDTMKKLIEDLRFSNETIKKNMFEMTELKQKFEAIKDKYNEYKDDTDKFMSFMSADLINTFLGFNTILKTIDEYLTDENRDEIKRISTDVMEKSIHSIKMIEDFIKNQRH